MQPQQYEAVHMLNILSPEWWLGSSCRCAAEYECGRSPWNWRSLRLVQPHPQTHLRKIHYGHFSVRGEAPVTSGPNSCCLQKWGLTQRAHGTACPAPVVLAKSSCHFPNTNARCPEAGTLPKPPRLGWMLSSTSVISSRRFGEASIDPFSDEKLGAVGAFAADNKTCKS